MTGQSQPRVAVVGMSESGRGWASLVAGAGWPLTIYDPDAALLHDAEDAVATRKRHSQGVGLPAMREPRDDSAPGQLRLGRSLLDAVSNADWIIDTTRSDLLHRQRLLEQIERAARMAAIVTCGAPWSFADGSLCPPSPAHSAPRGACPRSGGTRACGRSGAGHAD